MDISNVHYTAVCDCLLFCGGEMKIFRILIEFLRLKWRETRSFLEPLIIVAGVPTLCIFLGSFNPDFASLSSGNHTYVDLFYSGFIMILIPFSIAYGIYFAWLVLWVLPTEFFKWICENWKQATKNIEDRL